MFVEVSRTAKIHCSALMTPFSPPYLSPLAAACLSLLPMAVRDAPLQELRSGERSRKLVGLEPSVSHQKKQVSIATSVTHRSKGHTAIVGYPMDEKGISSNCSP